MLLSLAVNLDWPLWQFDMKNVFLHEDLGEVHMDFPPSFVNPKKEVRYVDQGSSFIDSSNQLELGLVDLLMLWTSSGYHQS